MIIRGSLVAVSLVALAAAVLAQAPNDAPPTDALTRLGQQLERGEATLEYRDGVGYLPSLLEHLRINVDSQTLVFSKTSFQQAIINPKNPRALYFNDEVAVGTVPGGDVYELLALEPSHGMVFYTLDLKRADQPRLRRRGVECFFCHAMGNKGALSLVVASVFPDKDGSPAYTSSFISTIDHRTPFEQRWGGWYVTGTHGAMRHMGNAIVTNVENREAMTSESTLNRTSLAGLFDARGYVSAHSDIAALMVFQHQAHMTNLITRVGWDARLAEYDHRLDLSAGPLRDAVNELVDYLLFVGEEPLTGAIKGTSGFAEKFAAQGPADSHGRSLRQLDLEHRLLRYPCSYMVYSAAFGALPFDVRRAIYGRMWDVLAGRETSPKYARLSGPDRRAVVEILRETLHDLPDDFRATDAR